MKMAELFAMDATPVNGAKPELGTEVRIFNAGDHLVAKADGLPVATIPKKFARRLKDEPEKRCVTGVATEDSLRISVLVPEICVKYREMISGENGTFHLIGDQITYQSFTSDQQINETRSVTSCTARVESGEELQSRVTATRLFLVGVFAFAIKKKSGGERYLTVEGPDFLWAVEFPYDRANEAVAFAAKINAAAKEALHGRFEPIEGLARPDGGLHVAVVSVAEAGEIDVDGFDIELSAALDAHIARLTGSGCDVLSAAPLDCRDGVVRVLVTYR